MPTAIRSAVGRERVSERRACQVLGQSRSTQRRQPRVPGDEPRLVRRMTLLKRQEGLISLALVFSILRR
jgi:hypothetical protein